MIIETKQLSFGVLLAFCAIIYYYIRQAMVAKELPRIRPIQALEAFGEAIGRATELGKPVHFSPGIGGIVEEEAGQMLASLQAMGYVAEQCARYKTELIVTICRPEIFPLAEEVVRTGFAAAEAPELFTAETVRFLSSTQMAYASAVLGIFQREKPAANFMIGAWYAETMLIAEGAAQAGAISIGGTARLFQLQFLVVVCDYTLLGEEVFVVGAYLGKDRMQLGSIVGQDVCKAICTIALVVGVTLRALKFNWLYDFMGKFGK